MDLFKPAHLYNIKIPRLLRKSFCLARRISDFKYNSHFKRTYNYLTEIHNEYRGKRCFVTGMGPSLDKTNFKSIQKDFFIVSNNFYEGQDRFKVNPQFTVVADDAVLKEHYCNLLDQNNILFLTEDAARNFLKYELIYKTMRPKKSNNIVIVKPLGNMDTFKTLSKDLRKGAYGGNVIFSCLQVAFHMGFKEVYLLGCDCTFKKGVHFKDSWGYGHITSNWEPTFKKYEICKKIFEKNGRKIYNATVGGDLEVFERRQIE